MTDWKILFDEEELREGKWLCASGKAKRPGTDEDGYHVRVRDDRNYDVTIYTDTEGVYDLECSCGGPYEDHFCRHCAAAFFLVEETYGRKLFLDTEAWEDVLPEDSAVPPKGDRSKEQQGQGSSAGQVKSGQKNSSGQAKTEQGNSAGQAKSGQNSSAGQAKAKDFSLAVCADSLKNLMKQEAVSRKKAAGSEDAADPDEYRYFHVENFRQGLGITRRDVQQAENLLAGMPKAHSFVIRLGYFSPRLYMSPYGDKTTDADGKTIGEISGAGGSRNDSWSVRMRFGQDSLTDSECRSWLCRQVPDPASPVGHRLCVHEMAAFLTLEQYLERNNPGDSTSVRADAFLDDYGGASGRESALKGEAELLKMEPYIRAENDTWYIQFRIGSKRLYKIRDMQAFTGQMQRHETVSFGKNTDLVLGKEYLDERSLVWNRFLEEGLAAFRAFMGSRNEDQTLYFYESGEGWTKITDRFPLFGELLDHFYECLGGEQLEFERHYSYISRGRMNAKDKEKFFLTKQEADIRPPLKLEPFYSGGKRNSVFEGVKLNGSIPSFIRGSRNAFFTDEKHLYRIAAEQLEGLSPLTRAADALGNIDIRIGRQKLSEFYRDVLPELRKYADIEETAPEIVMQHLPPEPSYTCYLDVDDDRVILRPEVLYGSRSHTPMDVYRWERGGISEHYRDMESERRFIAFLAEFLSHRDEANGILYSDRSEEGLYEFLGYGLSELMEMSEVRATDRFLRLKLKKRFVFNMGVSLESGIMDLSLTSGDLTPDELMLVLDGYRKKKRYIRLKNGDFLQIDDNEELAHLSEMMEMLRISPKEFVRGKMHIPAYRALYLEKMLEMMGDVYADRDNHFRKLIKEFKTVSDADYEVPASLRGVLRPYQVTGFRWLRTLDEYGFGGILADDMGLGKTLQAIAVLLAVRNEIPADRSDEKDAVWTSLVVCPASLVYNWQEELRKYAPELHTALIVGPADTRKRLIGSWRDYDVLVTSYDLLKRDIAEYSGKKFRFEIVDEAQYIKNHNTAAAKSVKVIESAARFALTGTPIENRLSELWSIFDYLMPGFLYEYSAFRNDIEIPAVKNRDEEVLEKLRRMVSPFILRRSKKEVLKDLPDKLEEIRYAGFEPAGEQQRLYDAQVVRMREDLMNQTDDEFRTSKIEILAELTRIRQICCDPSLIFDNYRGGSAKREACMDLIGSCIEGEHKALVFSQFRSMLELLEEDLREAGIPYYKIVGETPKEERLRLVNEYNHNDVPVFLISLRAGGTGLNLTGADVVIHYDPWWNLAVQNQASDRAHRIGQKKVVTVYKLIVKNTIEERIVEMQEAKRDLAENILSAEAVGSSAFNREELLELLEG